MSTTRTTNTNRLHVLTMEQVTFRDLGELWISSKKEKIKQSTYLKYSSLLDHYVNPEIGALNLSDLKIHVIDDAMSKIYWQTSDEHLSYSLMKSIIFITNSILKYGRKLELINYLEITFEISETKNNEIKILSSANIKKLTKYAVKHPSNGCLAIMLSLYTGLRIGEICALQRKDIDLDNNILYIRKTVQRLSDLKGEKTELVISNPKSRKASRIIPIPMVLQDLLKQYEIHLLPTDFFVLGKKEKPYEPRTVQYSYKRILKQCEIEYINFHCLRHTFATTCVRAGFDVKTLSEILGHSNVNFTMNKYVHSDIEEKRKQMSLLNNYFL